ELGNLIFGAADDSARVFADQHHHQPGHNLALAVTCDQAGADHRRRMHAGDVGDRYRHAVALVDHDRRDVSHGVRLAYTADVSCFAFAHDVAAAHVGVV